MILSNEPCSKGIYGTYMVSRLALRASSFLSSWLALAWISEIVSEDTLICSLVSNSGDMSSLCSLSAGIYFFTTVGMSIISMYVLTGVFLSDFYLLFCF